MREKVESSANGMTNFAAFIAITLLLLTMGIIIFTRNVSVTQRLYQMIMIIKINE